MRRQHEVSLAARYATAFYFPFFMPTCMQFKSQCRARTLLNPPFRCVGSFGVRVSYLSTKRQAMQHIGPTLPPGNFKQESLPDGVAAPVPPAAAAAAAAPVVYGTTHDYSGSDDGGGSAQAQGEDQNGKILSSSLTRASSASELVGGSSSSSSSPARGAPAEAEMSPAAGHRRNTTAII